MSSRTAESEKAVITIQGDGDHSFSIIDTTQGFDPLEQRRYLSVKWTEWPKMSEGEEAGVYDRTDPIFRGFWFEIQGQDPVDVMRTLGTHLLRMGNVPEEYDMPKSVTPVSRPMEVGGE